MASSRLSRALNMALVCMSVYANLYVWQWLCVRVCLLDPFCRRMRIRCRQHNGITWVDNCWVPKLNENHTKKLHWLDVEFKVLFIPRISSVTLFKARKHVAFSHAASFQPNSCTATSSKSNRSLLNVECLFGCVFFCRLCIETNKWFS